MTASALEQILPFWRASLPPEIPAPYFDAFVTRMRPTLEALVGAWFERRQARREVAVPPESATKASRTRRNIDAMRIVATRRPEDMTAEDRRAVLGYSGWGGLSIEAVMDQFPPGLIPSEFALIHEYYTPTRVAEAIADLVCPRLADLAGFDGVVRALEPSVGIGRLIRAMGPPRCLVTDPRYKETRWTAVELSDVSAKMFAAMRPDVELYAMSLEQWMSEHAPRYQGTLGLVLANPPYGERGEFGLQDKHPDYQERTSYAYFMRRCLDLLVPRGLGVFVIPAGFLTGSQNQKLRQRVLLRHHLEVAFRLPSETTTGKDLFPGAGNVVDVLVWRSRGGELREIDPGDAFILDGDYFKEQPEHILGNEVHKDVGATGPTGRKRRRYSVIGDFDGFPTFTARPVCQSCAIASLPTFEVAPVTTVTRDLADEPEDAGVELRQALELGRRVDRYLALVAAEDPRALGLWPELSEALRTLKQAPAVRAHDGNPWRWPELRALAERRALAQRLLAAYQKTGDLAPALAQAPNIQPKFRAQPGDVVAQAEHLHRSRRHLTVAELEAFHGAQGGLLDRADMLRQLLAAEWNLDGDDWDELVPLRAYLGGMLWPKYDRAAARAPTDPQAVVQLRRLEGAMNLAVFEDIRDISPRQGWVPSTLVSAWLTDTLNRRYGAVELMRSGGTIQPRGSDYAKLGTLTALTPESLWCIGWMNHDFTLFKPDLGEDEIQKLIEEDEAATGKPATPEADDGEDEESDEDEDLGKVRLLLGRHWDRQFTAWVAAQDDRRAEVRAAYNRSFRGIVIPTYEGGTLELARWNDSGPQLKAHQVAGVLRVLDMRGGLIAFDVGVGKTYTAIGVVAAARQEGWVRRPVVLVPSSLVWKWHDDFQCVLPDYRVQVIGSKRKRLSRGKRRGFLTSETDTPEERAEKWSAFQAGLFDVVILSYDALGRTQMNKAALLEYVKTVESLQRQVKLRQRNAAKKKAEDLSEREKAILKHGVRAFVEEMLELPDGHKFDPGIAWDDIGIDMLVVDEAAAFKNSYKPEAREHGLPKFMGSSGDGSKRAWQLDFRAAAVRQRTGGSGVVLLTATPAKNSPLEFYNLIQLIDPHAFSGRGLMDPEQFIDRFLRIESREIIDMTLRVGMRSVVDGFKNLDDLRTIIKRYGEFRSGAEVGLTLPEPRSEQVRVPLGPEQEDRYGELVRKLERALQQSQVQGSSQNKILGLLARLSLVALHAALDGGVEYSQALTSVDPADYAAPKLKACAERVAASAGCGHIIFCEPTAVHLWMREVLVAHKIPRERIAILNALETQSADRIRIAREFNGITAEPTAPGACASGTSQRVPPKYDVIIANSVAYEGIDLQTRTCAIHHLDLPWTPADLEQRNGRAVRQGNELPVVNIYYYLSDRSMDWYRYTLIQGKRAWLGDVLASQARDTSNPGAQQALSDEEILLMISRDPEATQRALDARREAVRAEARYKVAREAANLLIQAEARFRDARESTDTEKAARLRAEGDQRLRDLRRIDTMAWPWAALAERAREVEMVVPSASSAPVFEGLRVGRGKPGQVRYHEFGRVLRADGERRIGQRAHGFPVWELLGDEALRNLELQPADVEAGAGWPDEDETELQNVLEVHVDHVLREREATYGDLGWLGASDAWLARWWPRIESRVREGLAISAAEQPYPLVVGGTLTLASGLKVRDGELLAPTLAGWQRYLELAPASGLKFGELRDAGVDFWARKFPRGLLAAQDASATNPEAETSSTSLDVEQPQEMEHHSEVTSEEGHTPDTAPNVTPPAAAFAKPATSASSAFEDARSALKALALPPKKYAYFARRAEEAIALGKGWAPIVARARRVAEKLAGTPRPAQKPPPALKPKAPTPARPATLDSTLDSFNDEPRWRAEKVRPRANGHVLVIYPEGKDADAAVASVDVIHGDVDDIRWLDDRLTQNDRDSIADRLERALDAHREDDEEDDDDAEPGPSPLQELIDLMDRRSTALGARATKTADVSRKDGYRHIAEALRDLAKPTGPGADELQRWLESEDLMSAGEAVGRARGNDPMTPRQLMRDIWSGVFEVLTLEDVSGRPDALVVPDEAIFREDDAEFILQRVRQDERFVVRRVRIRVGQHDEDTGVTAIEDPTDRLTPGADIHRAERASQFYVDLYGKLGAFQEDLERAPRTLQDVRTLLYWSAVMLDAPLCRAEVKSRAAAAFTQAKAYYDTARTQILQGRSVDAVRRLHEAMARISSAAAQLARSCAEGQIDIGITPPHLPVRPEDRAIVEGTAMEERP